LVENFKDGFCVGKTAGFKSVKFYGDKEMVGQFVNVGIDNATAWGLSGSRIDVDGFARGYCGLKNKVIVILGTTASGKTRTAVALAKKYSGEIISADSRQVYRGMDLGTGKDLQEYGKIKYHLLDIISPKKQFTVAEYQKRAYDAINDILSRGKLPIICGGTGLYLDAITRGFQLSGSLNNESGIRHKLNKLSLKQLLTRLKKIDLKTYRIIDKKNRRRVQRALEIYYQTGLPKSQQPKPEPPPYEFLKIGVTFPREVLAKRIAKRLDERFAAGMINEVKKLRQKGISWRRLDEFGLEYRLIAKYLKGKISELAMRQELFLAIKNFAKRQMTWFKRDKDINWIKSKKEAEKFINKII